MNVQSNPAILTGFDHLDENGRNERFKKIFQNAPDAVFLIIADGPDRGRIVAANAAAERMHQYDAGELNGKSIMDLDSPDAARDAPDRLKRLLQDEILKFEIDHLRKDGSVFPVEVTASKIMIDDRPYILAFDREITDRKKAEAEHRNLQEQLLHSQKMDAVGQLAAGIAHEFNNIISSIVSNVEFIQCAHGQDLPEHIIPLIAEIEKAGGRATALTRQLLSFVRKKNVDVAVFNLNDAVNHQMGLLEQLLGDGVQIKVNLDGSETWVRANQSEIENAILNLCINARDAIDGRGKVTIGTCSIELSGSQVPANVSPGRFARLSVSDNGCGISKELQDRIFEPFFTTKPVGKGTGLGLSIVFANITNCEGFVTVDSEPAKGSTFHIHLPIAEATEPATTNKVYSESDSTARGMGELILVCDDDDMVLRSLSILIESFGYQVVQASGGTAAIEAVTERPNEFTMLITDISMQKIDGVQLGLMLKKLEPELKVICISGYGDKFMSAIREAQFEFVEKPVSGSHLSQLIRQSLNQNSTNAD